MEGYDTLCRLSRYGGGGIIFKSKWQAMTTYDSENLKSIVESANKSANNLLTIYEGKWWVMTRLRILNFADCALCLLLK